jgi:uncharacterized protein (DUF885 family)
MSRRHRWLFIRTFMGPMLMWPKLMALAFLWAFAPAGQAAEGDWIEQSNRYTQWLLDTNAQYNPEDASSNGLEQYDPAVMDLKPRYAEREEADLEAVAAKLTTALAAETDARVKQDLEILLKSARAQRETSALNRQLMVPYFDLGRILFMSFRMQLDPRLPKKRQAAALVRLHRYVGAEAGYEPIASLARARTEERLNDSTLTWPWVTEVERHLENGQRYREGIRDVFQKSGLKGWQKDFAVLSRQLTQYQDWVRANVLPKARKSNRLPEKIYADNLKSFGVEEDPHRLLERAQFAFMQTRDEMDALARVIAAQKRFPSADYRAVLRELKKTPIPQEQLLALYQGHLAQIEDIIRREHLVTLPKRDALIRLATEAESAAVPGPFLDPPRLIGNTGEPAIFVVMTSNPAAGDAVMDDFGYDAISWGLTTHEARPGHELQFSGMLERGVSSARAIYAFNSANVEGWALYAESIMKQYLPLDAQLCALQMRLMRAARAFLDPMLNLGMIEPEAAQRILTEEVVLSVPFAKKEVDRYTFDAPGQATAYFYGYSALSALRARTELMLGKQFVAQRFHDFIIDQGLLPIDLLDEAVTTQFIPSQKADNTGPAR